MSLTADAVIGLLETRFDYRSARAVFRTISKATGSDGPYDAAGANALADALSGENYGAEAVAAAIRAAVPAKAAPEKAQPKQAAKPPAKGPKK